MRGALRNGISKTELSEICLHSFLYCGGPASLDAFLVIKAALPELEAELKAEKKKR
jgi:4-carboxymuconolactone decarboxylase